MRRLFRKIHKWIFIFIGVAMLLWVGTGVFMALPLGIDWKAAPVSSRADYKNIRIPVSDVITRIEQSHPDYTGTSSVRLGRHRNLLVYVLTDRNNNQYIVDAVSGKQVQFNEKEAEGIVRAVFGIKDDVEDIQLVREHSVGYPYGVLPVYKIRFKRDNSISFYVNPADASVHKSTLLMRIRAIAGILHDFGPVEKLTGSYTLKWLLLFLVAVFALIGTIAGIYLTLPVRKRKQAS